MTITDATFARILNAVLSMPGKGLQITSTPEIVTVGPSGAPLAAEFNANEDANGLTFDEIVDAIRFVLPS